MSASATPLSVPGQSAPSVAEPVRRSAGIELGHKILLAGLSNCAASNGQSLHRLPERRDERTESSSSKRRLIEFWGI